MRISPTVRHWPSLAAGGLVAMVAAGMPAWAQEATPAAATPSPAAPPAAGSAPEPATPPASANTMGGRVVTPAAQAVLDRMSAALKANRRFEVTADVTRDEVLLYGYKLQRTERARMWVDAPSRMRVEVEGDMKDRTYIYDGARFWIYAPDANVYASSPAPDNLGDLAEALLDTGVELPLIDMLYHGNIGSLADDVRVGLVAGQSEIDGVMTDQLAFRQANVDWQLWVEQGARALPRKLLITTRYEVGDPQYQAVLTWNLKPNIKADAFSFTPPAGATEIKLQTQLAASGGDE
jgi:hypothetical protein